MSLKFSIGKRLLTSKFSHHSYRLLLFSLQAGAELEIEEPEITGSKGRFFMGEVYRVLNTYDSASQT